MNYLRSSLFRPSSRHGSLEDPTDLLRRTRRILSRALSWLQVFFMTFNIVFGVGYFHNVSYAFQMAGTGWTVVSLLIVGIIAFCVVDCISEMLSCFPITNPMVEFVRAFVDKDVALLVGTAYWLAYVVLFNSLLISATNLLNLSSSTSAFLTTLGGSTVVLLINCTPVNIYGHIEVFFGAVKVVFIIVMLALVGRHIHQNPIENTVFGPGDSSSVSVTQSAFVSMALAVCPFIGIESVATMSAEVYKTERVIPAMRVVAVAVATISVVVAILNGEGISRDSSLLAQYTTQGFGGMIFSPYHAETGQTYNLTALIAIVVNNPAARRTMNAALIFSAISAANTALYVGSRSIHGAFYLKRFHNRMARHLIGGIGSVSSWNTPIYALFVTWIALLWMSLINAYTNDETLLKFFQLLTNMATSTIVLVWASQCLAFIRFHQLRRRFRQEIEDGQFKLFRLSRNWMPLYQPVAAIVGLFGCLLLLLIFSSATLWNRDIESDDYLWSLFGLYSSPVFAAVYYVLLQLFRIFGKATELSHEGQRVRYYYARYDDWNAFKSVIMDLQGRTYPFDYVFDQRLDSEASIPLAPLNNGQLCSKPARPGNPLSIKVKSPQVALVKVTSRDSSFADKTKRDSDRTESATPIHESVEIMPATCTRGSVEISSSTVELGSRVATTTKVPTASNAQPPLRSISPPSILINGRSNASRRLSVKSVAFSTPIGSDSLS